MYHLRDTDGRRMLLAFHLTRGSLQESKASMFEPGSVVCIKRPFYHGFADGQEGIRIEDENFHNVTVRALCSLSTGGRPADERAAPVEPTMHHVGAEDAQQGFKSCSHA
jgi:hypothetical protein